MSAERSWYHVIWNTHGSWLSGDPRGFRNHDHRIHSSGDYKSPPPQSEHAGLLKYNQDRSAAAVQIPQVAFPVILEKVRQTIAQFKCELEAMSIASEHVHLLVSLPIDYEQAKAVVGKCKTYSSLAIRDVLPGTVWSRGCALKRIENVDHWRATQRYISFKQEKTALIWSAGQSGQPGSTARAVASEGVLPDATAQAVDPDQSAEFDPNHFTQSDAVEVRRVMNRGKGGRAVIARRDIAKGELIERVPVLLIPRTQVFGPNDIAQRAARISWYVFEWIQTKRGYVALSLGYGSIYNHSDDPNAEYDMELPDIMLFTAIKDIKAGEEILISYAGGAGIMKELGFEAEKTPLQAADFTSGADSGAGGEEA